MFFSELIKSIRASDNVLEVGPGATPHNRANEFLEMRFDDEQAALNQRGNVLLGPDFGQRKVTHYSGGRFPYRDNEFDYVIASHVVEHVPDPEDFMREVFRVGGGRGYIEFPLPPYEYLFDFDVHLHYLWFDAANDALRYVRKRSELVDEYSTITRELRRGFALGWDDVVRNNLTHFVEGFEFLEPFRVCESASLTAYHRCWEGAGDGLLRRLVRKMEWLLSTNSARR